jgi:predicted PurR-regulated permease PerM
MIKRSFLKFVPKEKVKICFKITKEINDIFVGYLRGQIWISIIVAIMSGIGLYFLRIKFYIILALLSGITNMIPYIGPIIGAIPAVSISFFSSPLQALGVILLYVFIQQVESGLIAPKIMSEKVGLHPLTIIFALLAGAELLGVWGLIFAVPVSGIIKVFIKLFLKN